MQTTRLLVRAWWPAAVWLSLIVGESTDYLSSDHTSAALYSVLTRLFGPINLYDFLVWHHYLRKTGHVIGYAMLCLLLFRAWRMTLAAVRRWKPALLAWLGTAMVASLDEWHQTFLPSRTGTIRDVILDSTAGLIALIILLLLLRRRDRAAPKREALSAAGRWSAER